MKRFFATGFVAAAALALPLSAFAICDNCGTVTNVRTVKKEGEASGAGAVIGGVAGGVLGHQVGSGRGNTAATIVGAGAGAYAGHQIEKKKNEKTAYVVEVKLENGTTRTFNYAEQTAFRTGDKVKIVDKRLVRQ